MLRNFNTGVRGLFNAKILTSLSIFLLLAVVIVDRGINRYISQLNQNKEFFVVEKTKTDKSIMAINQGQRGRFILKFKAKPSPLFALFFRSTPIYEMHAMLDNSGVLLALNSKLDKSIIGKHAILNFDFSSYIAVILSLLVSIFGFPIFQNRKHIKFFLNYTNFKGVFFELILPRVLYIIATVFCLFCIVVIKYTINKISLTQADFTYLLEYFLFTTALMVFFFLSSALAGLIKKVFLRCVIVSIIWPGLLILPGEVNEYVSNKSMHETISTYNQELKKIQLWTDYERSFLEKAKTIKTRPEMKHLYKTMNNQYIDSELKEIKKLENDLIIEISKIVKDVYFYNSIIPTAYHSALSCELSSFGYHALIDFYKFASEVQKFFVQSYFLNLSIGNFNFTYDTKSRPPEFSRMSTMFLLAYILIIGFVLFYKFKTMLFQQSPHEFSDVEINAQKGDYIYINVDSGINYFSNELFRVCFLNDRFNGKIAIGDGDSNVHKFKAFYLPDLSDIESTFTKEISYHLIGKPFSKIKFDDIKAMFPKNKNIDLIILDNVNLNIESANDHTIIEINPGIEIRQNNLFYYVSLDSDGQRFASNLKLENK